jgi:hypothetical protein
LLERAGVDVVFAGRGFDTRAGVREPTVKCAELQEKHAAS